MARYPSRSVGPVLRWHSAVLHLVPAVAAVFVATHGGNRWCNDNSFSCSLHTNLLVVVTIGAATTYWYFDLRRGLLLVVRYRRQLRAYMDAQAPRRGTVTCLPPGTMTSLAECWQRTGIGTPGRT
jgi:hypothetical protein